ncbi:GH32 C-terminal domain-containing protein [Leuconostoc palmae]
MNSSQILSGEFKIQMKTESFTINFLDNQKDTIIKLDFDINTNRLALEHIDHPKDRRYCHIQSSDQLKLDIFIDKSIMEIFVQDGEGVFTERYYVDSPLNIYMSGNKKPICFEAYDFLLEG